MKSTKISDGVQLLYRDDPMSLYVFSSHLFNLKQVKSYFSNPKNIKSYYSLSQEDRGQWCDIYVDYSTGLEFDNHIGGGYIITLEDATKEYAEVYVEWDDDWIAQHNIKNRESESYCVLLGIETLFNFLKKYDNFICI